MGWSKDLQGNERYCVIKSIPAACDCTFIAVHNCTTLYVCRKILYINILYVIIHNTHYK